MKACRILFLVSFAFLIGEVGAAISFVFDPEKNLQEVGWSYFAQVAPGKWRGRFPEGCFRYFTCVGQANSRILLRSVDGWSGWIDGDHVDIKPSQTAPQDGGVLSYQFTHGELTKLVCRKESKTFSYPAILPCPDWPTKLWKTEISADDLRHARRNMWEGSGRLRLWFLSPNACGAFLAECALALLALLFVLHARAFRLAASSGMAVSLVGMSLTQSRGALLAFLTGAACILCFWAVIHRAKVQGCLRKKHLWVATLFIALAMVILGLGYWVRFSQTDCNRHSDEGRFEMWGSVPAMMEAAPWGWNDSQVGRVYKYWFQPLTRQITMRNAINDHFTTLVRLCWPMRAAYIFIWCWVLIVQALAARKSGHAGGLAVSLSLATASSLNPILRYQTLFILPVLMLGWTLWEVRRLALTRLCLRSALFSADLTILLLSVFFVLGLLANEKSFPRIRTDGFRTLVKDTAPKHWVVYEGSVMDPMNLGKEIRHAYQENPSLPSLGFAWQLSDVSKTAESLTLLGDGCEKFLKEFVRNPTMRLPRRLVFISPRLHPEAIPASLRDRTDFRIVTGSLFARYLTPDGSIPSWVTVVPGYEIYLPMWVGIVAGGKN